MNKKKLAYKILSNVETLQRFIKKLNKKLNANKLSRKFESLIKRRFDIIQLLSPYKYSKKLESLFNRKISLPIYLTSDSFLNSIKLFIQIRLGLNLKSLEITNKKKNRNNLYNNLKNRIVNFKYIIINNRFRKNKIKIDKESHLIAVAFYSDHFLTVASVTINKDNQILVNSFIEVPVPGDVIGDSLVEDKIELSNILLDLFSLLKIDNAPLLVILSSSFFKINTFLTSELKQISNTDITVQSKSPYLPNDTFIEFFNLLKNSSQQKLVRTLYTNRNLIESWTDSLEILNKPIIGITPTAPNIFDLFKTKILDETTVLIEIEASKTIVIIGRYSTNLTTHNIPYGSSLYISDKDSELSNNYFLRILSSINLIMSEYNEKIPDYIYSYGKGLDELVSKNQPLPNKFKRLRDIKLADYSYSSNKNNIQESVSNSIDSTIEALVMVTSCL